MTEEILKQIDSRIKAITDEQIQAIAMDHKTYSARLNTAKIELLDLKIWICDLAQTKIKEKLQS